MSKPLAVVYDRFYVEKEVVDLQKVKKKFTHIMYEDKACAKCPELENRHSYICDQCPAYHGTIKTFNEIERHGQKFIGLPLGQKKNFLDFLYIDDWSELEIREFRKDAKFDYPIIFGGPKKGVLRDYQQVMCDKFLKARYGLIESPPRSGKTISALYIGVEYGRRMLVVANQKEFLSQFEDHVRDFTNLPKLEKKHGVKLFGRAKTYEEFEQYQIATATIQTFYSEKGQDLLRRICKFYGNVWFDECFTYGHRVKTDKGLVSIGDIVTGKVKVSKVLSFNHDLDKNEYKPIISVTQKKTKRLCRVLIAGEYYVCTPNHEFYVVGKGYVKAQDLKVGDNVQDVQNSVLNESS